MPAIMNRKPPKEQRTLTRMDCPAFAEAQERVNRLTELENKLRREITEIRFARDNGRLTPNDAKRAALVDALLEGRSPDEDPAANLGKLEQQYEAVVDERKAAVQKLVAAKGTADNMLRAELLEEHQKFAREGIDLGRRLLDLLERERKFQDQHLSQNDMEIGPPLRTVQDGVAFGTQQDHYHKLTTWIKELEAYVDQA